MHTDAFIFINIRIRYIAITLYMPAGFYDYRVVLLYYNARSFYLVGVWNKYGLHKLGVNQW